MRAQQRKELAIALRRECIPETPSRIGDRVKKMSAMY